MKKQFQLVSEIRKMEGRMAYDLDSTNAISTGRMPFVPTITLSCSQRMNFIYRSKSKDLKQQRYSITRTNV